MKEMEQSSVGYGHLEQHFTPVDSCIYIKWVAF